MYSGVSTPRSHLFNQRRKPSFAFEVNAFSFYWLQQPQAGGPLLGPHSKSSAKVSKIRSSQNWKIQSSFFLSYKTTTKVWDFGMGDGDFAASCSFSSMSVSEIMLYRDCASQLPYLERNKCGNGAAEVPLLESRTDLSWCFWRKLSEIEAGGVETVYPVGNQLHARWTSSLQSVSPGMLLFMGSRLESIYQLPGHLLEKLLSLSFKMQEKRKGAIFKGDWSTSPSISLLCCA